MTQHDYEARLRESESRNIEYANEIIKRDSKIQELHVRIRELESQLNSERGVIAALTQLYHSVDNKIMRTLNEKGQRKQTNASSHPAINKNHTNSYNSLLKSAREYDVKEFFALKGEVQKHDLRPGYRIVAKSYRVLRDGSISGIKKIYHLGSSN